MLRVISRGYFGRYLCADVFVNKGRKVVTLLCIERGATLSQKSALTSPYGGQRRLTRR